jgi:hypothetical protein
MAALHRYDVDGRAEEAGVSSRFCIEQRLPRPGALMSSTASRVAKPLSDRTQQIRFVPVAGVDCHQSCQCRRVSAMTADRPLIRRGASACRAPRCTSSESDAGERGAEQQNLLACPGYTEVRADP